MSGLELLRALGIGALATMFGVRGSSLCLTLKRYLVSGQPGLAPTVFSYPSHFWVVSDAGKRSEGGCGHG